MSVPVNIPKEYKHLERKVDELHALPGNPREGSVDGIIASYTEYGQTKPIVGYEDEDGQITIIAGNHQLMAAREMGWDRIAVMLLPIDKSRAIGYALTDNRLSEMGHMNEKLLFDMVESVVDDMPVYMEALGWDDFELALMEPDSDEPLIDTLDHSKGWQPPELVTRGSDEDEDDDEMHWTGDKDAEKELVTQGADSAGVSGSKKSVFQYTLVFDTPRQQSDWYVFLRWLKQRSAIYPGETTAEQLIAFLADKTEPQE